MKSICQNQTAEWSFASSKAYNDPFNELELSARFIHEGGEEKLVPASWTGGKNWRVRFSSPLTGRWRFQTVCSDASDAGLHGRAGDFTVTPYKGGNPLYRHGPIQIAADKRHFEHYDGTPFFWLGDTWWMGLCKRLTWPAGFRTLTKDRVKKGFTVVQIVAGLYPDMPAFDERGANEAGFPWEKDYSRINPSYFDLADRRIRHLIESGVVPCIVGCWGYFLPWMGVQKMKKHWRNLVARYGSYPVLWCLAGEAIMPYYLSSSKQEDAELQKKGWNELAGYVREIDPYRRPVTAHPGSSARMELGPKRGPIHVLEEKTRILAALEKNWRFKIDPDNCGEIERWQETAPDESWKPIGITAPWTDQGYDYHGAAWYKAECSVPHGVKKPLYLFFHAVDGTAKVWIDGIFAGEQSKPADIMWNKPWALDIGRHINLKKKVRITVKVVKEAYACGVYKPVELRVAGEGQNPADIPGLAASKNAPCYDLVKSCDDSSILDFDMLQTGHGPYVIPRTIKLVTESRRRTPAMPVVEGEVFYEGIGGTGGYQQVQRWLFWACVLNGTAGYTYGANGIWQVNTRKKPYGPSPHGMSWGDTPWEDACQLPGSVHLALAKRLLERYEWWKFEPHPEWVAPSWTDDLNDMPFTIGRHDIVPLAAGIPGKVRIIYVPLRWGLPTLREIEKNAQYRAKFFDPVTGAEREIGAIKPDANGNWNFENFLPPVYQDWIIVMEAKYYE